MKAKTQQQINDIAECINFYPGQYLRLEGYLNPVHSSADKDGDYLTAEGCKTYTDMCGNPLRVLISKGYPPRVAARQLMKLAKWLKKSPQLMDRAECLGGPMAMKPHRKA